MAQFKDKDFKSGELFDRALSNIRHLLGNSVSTLKITLEVLLENYDQFDETKKNELLCLSLGVSLLRHYVCARFSKHCTFYVSWIRDYCFFSTSFEKLDDGLDLRAHATRREMSFFIVFLSLC